jgi:putative SOS response-associated peptidase YedK
MCYHNSLNTKPGELSKRYGLKSGSSPKISSASHVSGFSFPTWPILTAQNPNPFLLGDWSLVLGWVQDSNSAEKLRFVTLNARIETLQKKPSFIGALKKRHRWILPSTGFFEWQKVGNKIPYYIALKDVKICSIAGLWDVWVDRETGSELITFTIITGSANPLMAKVYNQKERMPAVLEPQIERKWLDNRLPDINELLHPIQESLLTAYPIKSPLKAVNTDFDEITRRLDHS